MAFIGDLLGAKTSVQTQGANQAQADEQYQRFQNSQDQQLRLLNALHGQGGLAHQENIFQMQSQLAQQLQQQALGQGPNPAQAQLAQNTGTNVANQAALMAGQRGANANAGLIARQAAQQGAATQQQATGQAATLQANQQLAAQQALQQQQQALAQGANQMAGQYIGQSQNLGNQALQGYGTAIGSLNNQNSINANVAQGNAQMNANIAGGLLGAAGTALAGPMGGIAASSLAPKANSAVNMRGAGSGTMYAASGGVVPGKAPVAGDSRKNDIVDAKLSPGELVIPRSVVEKGPEAVLAFAKKVLEEHE